METYSGCPIHAVSSHDWASCEARPLSLPMLHPIHHQSHPHPPDTGAIQATSGVTSSTSSTCKSTESRLGMPPRPLTHALPIPTVQGIYS